MQGMAPTWRVLVSCGYVLKSHVTMSLIRLASASYYFPLPANKPNFEGPEKQPKVAVVYTTTGWHHLEKWRC